MAKCDNDPIINFWWVLIAENDGFCAKIDAFCELEMVDGVLSMMHLRQNSTKFIIISEYRIHHLKCKWNANIGGRIASRARIRCTGRARRRAK